MLSVFLSVGAVLSTDLLPFSFRAENGSRVEGAAGPVSHQSSVMAWVPAESQKCAALDLPTASEHDFSSWSRGWASSSSPGFWGQLNSTGRTMWEMYHSKMKMNNVRAILFYRVLCSILYNKSIQLAACGPIPARQSIRTRPPVGPKY